MTELWTSFVYTKCFVSVECELHVMLFLEYLNALHTFIPFTKGL